MNIPDFVEIRIMAIISDIGPATTTQICKHHRSGTINSTLTHLKRMMAEGKIEGVKQGVIGCGS